MGVRDGGSKPLSLSFFFSSFFCKHAGIVMSAGALMFPKPSNYAPLLFLTLDGRRNRFQIALPVFGPAAAVWQGRERGRGGGGAASPGVWFATCVQDRRPDDGGILGFGSSRKWV